MILDINNPVYNTIIIFSVIMLLLYITKPNVIYDNEKNEFRQFGTTDGKTLLPIYVVGMLLAIILYVFFYYLSQRENDIKHNNHNNKESFDQIKAKPKSLDFDYTYSTKMNDDNNSKNTEYYGFVNPQGSTKAFEKSLLFPNGLLQQQIQLQNLQNMQNQLNQLVIQQQISSQLTSQLASQSLTNKVNCTDSVLPNSLNV